MWVLVNRSERQVKVNFAVRPETGAFKYPKEVILKPKGTSDQRLKVDVDKLPGIWKGVLVLKTNKETKKIPMRFEKTVPVH